MPCFQQVRFGTFIPQRAITDDAFYCLVKSAAKMSAGALGTGWRSIYLRRHCSGQSNSIEMLEYDRYSIATIVAPLDKDRRGNACIHKLGPRCGVVRCSCSFFASTARRFCNAWAITPQFHSRATKTTCSFVCSFGQFSCNGGDFVSSAGNCAVID